MSDSPEEVAYSAVAEKWFNGAQGYWVMKYIATAVAASREAGLLVDSGHFEYAHTVDDVIVPHRWAPAERRTKPVSTHRRTVGRWVPVVDTETRSNDES